MKQFAKIAAVVIVSGFVGFTCPVFVAIPVGLMLANIAFGDR